MNRFAALINSNDTPGQREQRLRDALFDADSATTVLHPAPNATLAWTGDAGLSHLHTTDAGWIFLHGAGHAAPGLAEAPPPRVDEPLSLAARILEQANRGQSPVRGLAGAFVALVSPANGPEQLLGDPSGGRPPFYSLDQRELAVSNHPLVCARLQAAPAVDRSFEDFLLVYGFLPDGRTIYRGVRQLAPGHVLTAGKDKAWKAAALPVGEPVAPYADIPENEIELLDRLHAVMLRCLSEQLPAEEEVGVLLGGFDSALVASMLKSLGKRVRTYSFRYTDNSFNQPHTDTLSAFLGSEHTWIDITPSVIAEGIAHYGHDYVQPTNWLNYVIQTTHVCRQMRRDGLRYVYSGDGCDAVFLGYPGTYKRTHAYSRLPQLPEKLVRVLSALLARPWLDRMIGHPYRVAMGMLRATARPMPARAFLSFRVLDEGSLVALRLQDPPEQEEQIESILARLAYPFANTSIQRLGYAAKALVSPNRAKMLAATDLAGVRVFAPYLHPGLKGFAASIPDAMIRNQADTRLSDPGKICLMKMAERHHLLPPELIHQRKLAAIDSPIDEWFAGPLRSALTQATAGLPFTPEPGMMDALVRTTTAESLYKRYIGSTRVISDAASLLATYGACCNALNVSADE